MKTLLFSLIALAITTSAIAQAPTVKTMLELTDSTTEAQRHDILAKVGYAYKFVKTEDNFYGMQGYKAKTFVPKNAVGNSENTNIIMTCQDKAYIGVDYRTTVKDNYDLVVNSFNAIGYVPDPKFNKKKNKGYTTLHNEKNYKTYVTHWVEEKDGKTNYFVQIVYYPFYTETSEDPIIDIPFFNK